MFIESTIYRFIIALILWFFSNPTPDVNNLIPTKWKPIKSDKFEYYFIKNGSVLYMDENLYSERAEFWRSLPIDFRRERIRDEL